MSDFKIVPRPRMVKTLGRNTSHSYICQFLFEQSMEEPLQLEVSIHLRYWGYGGRGAEGQTGQGQTGEGRTWRLID